MAVLIDGKATAKKVRAEVAEDVARLEERGVQPALAVVLVGEDPASAIYVRNKVRACKRTGITSIKHTPPADIGQADLLALVDALNADPAVHGILVQMPLPGQIDPTAVLERIDPDKDVDGFHPTNVGRLSQGHPRFVSCTPAGIMRLLAEYDVQTQGADAVVIGRSNIVGRPMATLLTNHHATVTVCHSRTRGLADHVRRADILVAAVGRAEMVRGDWIKPGAAVIDVGMNRLDDGRLVGDVCFQEAREVAGAITPVPGGVGPMTIAMLMSNTADAARRRLEGEVA